MSNNTAAAGSPRKPTEKEAFFFLTILNSMKNKPEVDWDRVASRAGYSNGVCAKTRFGQIKRQIGYRDDGSLPTPSPVKPRTKKAVGSGTNTTPSKIAKKKSPGRKEKATKSEPKDEPKDDEADDELVLEDEIDDGDAIFGGGMLEYKKAQEQVYGGYENGEDDDGFYDTNEEL